MKRSPTYSSWENMRARCLNPNAVNYAFYGGRGITVCERWASYRNFLADMGERPPNTTLDRIDNSAGYSPDNCRWTTRKQQSRNTRANRLLTLRGETKPLIEWSEVLGIHPNTLVARVERGQPPDAPLKAHERLLTFEGATCSVIEWSRRTGISRRTIGRRLDSGWPVEAVLSRL